jgi:NADH:ubiquinone oxidoreductase subunit F (NADH-binding)
MDGSMLQTAGLIALAVAMILTIYDLRASLSPESCSECTHCRERAEADRLRQERLSREYARRHGFDRDDDDHRRIG